MPPQQHSPHPLLAAQSTGADTLAARGWNRRALSRAVRAGTFLRLRRDVYVSSDTNEKLARAARLGGRLDCVSLLAEIGVFVLGDERLHVQVSTGMSRLPQPDAQVVRHWRRTTAARRSLAASLIEALAQACRCQSPRDAIATLDSAWHRRLVDKRGIDLVFALLPRRYRRLRPLLDRRSESGSESIMRLMLRGLGCHVECQVTIPTVGRVDFLVDGWLIVECDSRAHHEGWDAQKRDRRRDLAAAARGFTTIRPIAEDILFRREETLASLKGVLAAARPPAAHNSSAPPAHNSSHSVRPRRVMA